MTGPDTPDPVVLRAPRLLDGTGAAPVPEAALLVSGGRIAYAGPAAGLPDGAERLPAQDFPGATLLPGLVDAHVHLVASGDPDLAAGLPKTEAERMLAAVVNARRNLDQGVTLVRDLGAPGAEAVLVGRAVEEGTLAGPRVSHNGERRRHEQQCEAIRQKIWTALDQVGELAATPVVLTNTSLGRQALREAVASELPDLPIMARIEIRPEIRVESLLTIHHP